MVLPPEFFRLYEGLPRQGPGREDLTLAALHRLAPLPASARVLDLGCGSGAQTLVLARALGARILAIDNHPSFLRELERRARAMSLSNLVDTQTGDMNALWFAPGSFDLIWCEGAIYIVGFEEGLRRWRPWLAPGGQVAVTECSWLVDAPPAEARAYFDAAYPAMGDVGANCERARRAGFDLIDTFALPSSAWWDDYYTPLLARADALESEARENATLAAAIADARQEVELFRRFGETYGYVFYLCRNPLS